MNKKLYFILALILAFTHQVNAQTITGTVNSGESPLTGANIKIEGKKLETSTNGAGQFELKVAPGTYNLQVSYIGYTKTTQKVTLAKDQVLHLNFILQPSNIMDEVVVVSSRKPSKISEIPGTVWVVDHVRLQEQIKAGIPLKEALSQLIPGLDVGPQGRTNFGQNLRGQSILVMVDGVSLNSTRGTSRQFDAIDPFNIERIEVLSGASSIYGGGATGGIVNIITRRGQAGEPAFSTEVSGRSGLRQKTDHDLRIAQSISGGSEDFKGRIGIAYQKNNAAFDASNKQIFTDITQTDLQYNQSFDIFANTEFKLTAKQTLKVAAQYYNSGYEGTKDLYLGPNMAGLLSNSKLLEMRDGFTSSVKPKTSRAQITADYHAADILGGQDLYVQAASRNEQFSFHPFPAQVRNAPVPGGIFLYSSSSVQETNYSAVKALLTKQWSSFNVTYGIDADHEHFNAYQVIFDRATAFASGGMTNNKLAKTGRYPDYHVNGLSGYLQAQWNITPALSLSGGIRQQRMYVNVADFAGVDQQSLIAFGIGKTADAIPGGKNHYDVNLLNAGLVYKIFAPEQVWLNFAEGFTLADPAKYYGYGSYTLNGTNWALNQGVSVATNPLTGIKTKQLEAGWRHRDKHFNAQIAGFYSWADKNIATVLQTLSVVILDQKRRNTGVEGSISYHMENGFDIGGNGLYIKSQKKEAGSWIAQGLGDASPSKATAFLGWSNAAFGLKIQGLRSFDLKDAVGNKYKAYNIFDVLGNVKLPVGNLAFGVQNVLNKNYQTIWSQRSEVLYKGLGVPETYYYSGRGRTFNLSYTINY